MISRPSPQQLFVSEVAETIHNQTIGYRSPRTMDDYEAVATRIIDMVRKHDTERDAGAPDRALSAPPPFPENQHVMRANRHVMQATPAHQDREERSQVRETLHDRPIPGPRP